MPRMPKPRSVSIRDVAELAGVSLGSASRVINKVDNVTAQTREKVERAIAALGYHPNHAAQSLRLRSSRTVGCLLTDVSNPLYAKLFRALEERLRKAGYMMLLANSLNLPEREIEILSTFKSRGMDGVFLAPGSERDREVEATLARLDMPAVILDRDMAPDHDRVLFDHAPGMVQVVTHLASFGHRHMALLVSQLPNRPMRRRVEGFRAGHAALGLPLDENMIVRLPSSTSSGFDAVTALLKRTQRPTAIISMGTTVLNDTLNAAGNLGLCVPTDVSVVSLGDPAFAATHSPPLNVLRVDLETAADCATELLLARMNGDQSHPARCITVPSQYIQRQSCAQAPSLTPA